MVRLAGTPSNGRRTVELCVIGPKSIIPKTVTVKTSLGNNWLAFFTTELKIDVPLDQGIFVCSSQYCPSAPKEGEGWHCNLNEPIRNYINKFERRRNRYNVRICRPSGFTRKRGRASTTVTQARSPTPGPNVQRNAATKPLKRLNGSRVASPNTKRTHKPQQSSHGTRQKQRQDQSQSSGEPITVDLVKQEMSESDDEFDFPIIMDVRSISNLRDGRNGDGDEDDEMDGDAGRANASNSSGVDLDGREVQGDLEEFGQEGNVFVEEDDDAQSVSTAVSEQEDMLRREGIEVEDVKSAATRRLDIFSNSFMLRMRNEMRQLMGNNRWHKNAERAPMVSFFVSELFK